MAAWPMVVDATVFSRGFARHVCFGAPCLEDVCVQDKQVCVCVPLYAVFAHAHIHSHICTPPVWPWLAEACVGGLRGGPWLRA